MTERRDYDEGAWIQGGTARIPARGEPFGGPIVVDDTPPEIKEHRKREEYKDGLFYEVENLAQLYGDHHTTLAEARKTMPLADATGFRERSLKAYDADVLAKAEGAPTDEARQRFTDGAMDLRHAFDTMTTETESIFHDTKRRSALGIKAGALSRQAQAYPEDYALHAAMLDKVVAGMAPLVKSETAAKFRAVEAEKMARSAMMGFIEQGRFDEGRALLSTATDADGNPGPLPLPPEAVKELSGMLEERHADAVAREGRLDRVDTVIEGTAGPTDDLAEWRDLVEEHFEVAGPQMAELKPAERIGAEDDYVRTLGHLPMPLTRSMRAGMLSGEPEHEAAAALRLKTLADHDPTLIEAIPKAERARSAAIAEFAELGLKPERAVELGEKKLAAQNMRETAEPGEDSGADDVSGGVGDNSREDGTRDQDLVPRDLNPEDAAKDAELRDAVRDKIAEGDKVEEDPEKDTEPEIEWMEKPEQTLFKGEVRLKVKGPVKVDLVSPTLGFDGLEYKVDWHPLDKNGKVMPVFRRSDQPLAKGGGHALPFVATPDTFKPPFDHPHGFEVRIWIPPQAAYHGNSAGPYLNIYTPKGKNDGGGRN